jgi:DNA-directed RNA polymerase subunit RPC12/RpoP
MRTHKSVMNGIYYQCDHCEYKSTLKQRLYYHMYKHKSRESQPKFKCEFCPMIFTKRFVKDVHEKKIHKRNAEPEDPITCECGKTFKTAESYKSHWKNAHENREYSCDTCSEAFKTKNMLQHHQMKHKPKITCKICGNLLYQGESYKGHMRNVHRIYVKTNPPVS